MVVLWLLVVDYCVISGSSCGGRSDLVMLARISRLCIAHRGRSTCYVFTFRGSSATMFESDDCQPATLSPVLNSLRTLTAVTSSSETQTSSTYYTIRFKRILMYVIF